jgi:hypothetical protein
MLVVMVMGVIMATVLVMVMAVGMNFFSPMVVLQGEDLPPCLGSHHMDGTGEAGVEGMDYPHNLYRLSQVLNRRADQRLFDGAKFAGAIPGGGVPAGGGDNLVAGDFAAADL